MSHVPVTLLLSGWRPEHWVEVTAHWVSAAAAMGGVLAILIGGIVSTAQFLLALPSSSDFHATFERYRRHLGRAILLGLEFLVAADLLETIVLDLNYRSLGVLAGLVLIRTFLSLALTVEIDRAWPWRPSREDEKERA